MERGCCIFGQRAEKLPWKYDEERPECKAFKARLHAEMTDLVKDGVTAFYTDMSDGVNMIAAEIVLQIKGEMPEKGVRLIGVLPHEEQAAHWTVSLRERYFNAMANADEEVLISSRFTKTCYRDSMQYMMSNSTHMIIVINGNIGRMQPIVDSGNDKGMKISIIDIGELSREKC